MPRGKLVTKVLHRDALSCPTTLPEDTMCLQVVIPNDLQYLLSFEAVLGLLGKWNSYRQDGAHQAADVAQLWRDVFAEHPIQVCETAAGGGVEIEDMSRFRIDPDNCSIIQIECRPDEWEQFYPPKDCKDFAPGQPGPGGDGPTPGESQEYCTQLAGNSVFLVPVGINTGDIITVTNVSGGWSDGSIPFAPPWNCPNGQAYEFGGCAGGTSTSGSDPLPTAPHMKLLMSVDGVLHEYDETVTVPSGVTNGQLQFFANDDNITDNLGSVKFCVQIKNGNQATFTHHFDFRESTHGFVAADNGVTDAHWQSGVGWVASTSSTPGSGVLGIALDRATPLYGVTLRYKASGSSITGSPHGLYSWPTGGLFTTPDEVHISSDASPIDFSNAFTGTVYGFGANNNGGADGDNVIITDLYITAVGVDPFLP